MPFLNRDRLQACTQALLLWIALCNHEDTFGVALLLCEVSLRSTSWPQLVIGILLEEGKAFAGA